MVWPLAIVVAQHMSLHTSFLGKSLVADCTLEWFLPVMDSHVHCQIPFKFKPFFTDFTLKWPLAGMNSHVLLQMANFLKLLTTDITASWSCSVYHHMTLQIGCTGAGLVADVAGVHVWCRE